MNGRELANSPRSASTFPLDRLSRSLSDLLNILTKLEQVGADFKSLTESIDTTSAAGRMMMQMLGSFAEFERAMLRERTKLGLARARAAGRKGGARSKLSLAGQKEAISMMEADGKTQVKLRSSSTWIVQPSPGSSQSVGCWSGKRKHVRTSEMGPPNETFNIGADTGTPVDDQDYQVPFTFTGKLDKLTIKIDRPQLTPADIKLLEEQGHRNNRDSE